MAALLAPAVVSAAVLDVPFDFSSGVIVLDADLGGSRPCKLVFDTGNVASVLDADAAKELGLTPAPDAPSATPAPYHKLPVPKVTLGGQECGTQTFYTAPFRQQVADDYGVHADGTLGYGFFKDRIVQIDYPARRFRLLDRTASPMADNRDAAKITWHKYSSKSPDLVTVDNVDVAGRTVAAQVDTFLAQNVILFSTKLPWLKTEPAAGVTPIKYEEARIPAVRIIGGGGVALGACRTGGGATVFLAGADAHTPETELAVILGNGFFAGKVLTLDFAGSRLVAQPSSKP